MGHKYNDHVDKMLVKVVKIDKNNNKNFYNTHIINR